MNTTEKPTVIVADQSAITWSLNEKTIIANGVPIMDVLPNYEMDALDIASNMAKAIGCEVIIHDIVPAELALSIAKNNGEEISLEDLKDDDDEVESWLEAYNNQSIVQLLKDKEIIQ